jgi:type I restriction enzyme R subunit
MQDHGLFQAICRTNRLDGEHKTFGYIVDFRHLFQKLVNDEGTGALQVYGSELDHSAPGASPEVVMQGRVTKGREMLDAALEALELLCAPVAPPHSTKEFQRYFCGNTQKAGDLAERAPLREAFYKAVASLIRAYANVADALERAGYSPSEIKRLKEKVHAYEKVRDEVRLTADEVLDMKPYEADMRHLIDMYVEARTPRTISPFGNKGLLQVIALVGVEKATTELLGGLGGDREAIAETIENNVRAAISRQELNDPAFYAKMSALLDEVIRIRKERAEAYERYLQEIAKLVVTLQAGHAAGLPKELDSPGKVALYNNLDGDAARALDVDRAVREARPDGWRGVGPREQMVKRAIFEALKKHGLADPAEVEREVERVFAIVKAQKEY